MRTVGWVSLIVVILVLSSYSVNPTLVGFALTARSATGLAAPLPAGYEIDIAVAMPTTTELVVGVFPTDELYVGHASDPNYYIILTSDGVGLGVAHWSRIAAIPGMEMYNRP